MCGLVGLLISAGSDTASEIHDRLSRMSSRLTHRGPDDDGVWVDAESGVGLAFRRLSILDLSPLGAQPMRSASGRFVVVFNGEVYNFLELRSELATLGHTFVGRSDTEVLLASFEQWGIEHALTRFVGMFAMAIWDRSLRRLTLTRDRLGIKPLYYSSHGGSLLFASEVKALRVDRGFVADLDHAALAHYLTYLYVPAPLSIFRHVKKLPPGHFLHIDDPAAPPAVPQAYWSLPEVAARGRAARLPADDESVLDELQDVLTQAVKIRLRSDVPLGVLLSGGVDSSIVAALAQSQLDRPIKTFSIGFDSPEHDESRHAREVAALIGSEHVEHTVTGDEARATLSRLAAIYDEPLADPSQIPTLLVSEVARREVTVALSGDGGDELFSGYNRYISGARMIPLLRRVPQWLRGALPQVVGAASSLGDLLPRSLLPRLADEKWSKIDRLIRERAEWEMYRSLLGVGWSEPSQILRGERPECEDIVQSAYQSSKAGTLLDRMMLADQMTYLPDDLLAKVDRASMAVSLEARVPILDHRVVELSWQLERRHRIRNGRGKWALRHLLYRHLPRHLVDRPKVGFTPPIGDWLRGPLRDWARDLLDPARLEAQGVFDAAAVGAAWESFLSGRRANALGIWGVAHFQAWASEYL